MTHNNPTTIVASLVHASVCEYVFSQSSTYFDNKTGRRSFLTLALSNSIKFQNMYLIVDENSLSVRLIKLLAKFDTGLYDEDIMEISNGGTHYCIDSLTMVYGLFAQHTPSFNTIIKATLIGGDTDSNASMLGGLIGGLKGRAALDETHIDHLYQSDNLLQLGNQFASLFQQQLPKQS